VTVGVPQGTSGVTSGAGKLVTDTSTPPVAGGTNWEAYTHEELHGMLWQDADVADVSAVAEEWRKHSAALADHAVALREQQTALKGTWEGEAADLAVTRLGDLADRVDDISAHAATAQQAAQEAADALARARAMMPPPPTAPPIPPGGAAPAFPGALPAVPAVPTVPAMPTVPTVPSASSMGDPATWFSAPTAPAAEETTAPDTASGSYFWFGAPPQANAFNPATSPSFFMTFGAPPTTNTGSAFNSMATGGSSMYFNTYAADQAKSQAVYTMRVYESSLHDGNGLTATYAARSYGTGRAPAPGQPFVGRGAGDVPQPGGVPWDRLVGSNPLRQGPAVGVGATSGGMAVPHGVVPAESAAGRGAGHGGMVPPVAPRSGTGENEENHENRMPTIDQGLFAVDTRASAPVIGVGGD